MNMILFLAFISQFFNLLYFAMRLRLLNGRLSQIHCAGFLKGEIKKPLSLKVRYFRKLCKVNSVVFHHQLVVGDQIYQRFIKLGLYVR